MNERLTPSPPNYGLPTIININRSVLVMKRDTTTFGCAPEEWRECGGIGVMAKCPREVCARKRNMYRRMRSLSFRDIILLLINARSCG